MWFLVAGYYGLIHGCAPKVRQIFQVKTAPEPVFLALVRGLVLLFVCRGFAGVHGVFGILLRSVAHAIGIQGAALDGAVANLRRMTAGAVQTFGTDRLDRCFNLVVVVGGRSVQITHGFCQGSIQGFVFLRGHIGFSVHNILSMKRNGVNFHLEN